MGYASTLKAKRRRAKGLARDEIARQDEASRSYYEDAIEHDRSLFGIEYEGVRDFHISRLIMIAYWERYAVEWTAEELCRLHNGGPSKRYTDEYWDKCRQIIK